MIRRLLPLLFLASSAMAQNPTFVQSAVCPNSSNTGSSPQSATPDYICPLPEPSQSGNAILLGMFSDNGGTPTFTISDDKSNTYTLAQSATDGSSNIFKIFVALNIAAGTHNIKVHRSANTGFLNVIIAEYQNIATSSAIDAHNCNAHASSTTITAGSITPTVSGDLLWMFSTNSNGSGGITTSFTAGSQANITWAFDGTDINDSAAIAEAVQSGVYNSTSAINPTFTTGTAGAYDSCVVALKAASAGAAPTQSFRALHILHQNFPNTATSPVKIQVNATGGNFVVIALTSGGDRMASVTSTPSNTWTCTTGVKNLTGINFCYAANASVSNAMVINVTKDVDTSDGTFLIYVFTGAATSPADTNSTGESGTQSSIVTSLTTCSSCETTAQANEMVLGAAGWANCTATAFTAPTLTGGGFDAATDTNNNVDGPQTVDQNNGWLHGLKAAAGSITGTWTMACGAAAPQQWASQFIAFKGAAVAGSTPAINKRAKLDKLDSGGLQ